MFWLHIEKATENLSSKLMVLGEVGVKRITTRETQIILRNDVFGDFLEAHKGSDFPAMRKILDRVVEFNRDLPHEPVDKPGIGGSSFNYLLGL